MSLIARHSETRFAIDFTTRGAVTTINTAFGCQKADLGRFHEIDCTNVY